MTKRFVSILLALILASSAMISCSDNSANADDTAQAGTADTSASADTTPAETEAEELTELSNEKLRAGMPFLASLF